MKIAIIASNEGEKALYIHDFFKEGNRIDIDCLLTEDPASPVAERFRREGIEVIAMSQGEQLDELSRLLKERDVELIVVDDLSGDLPDALRQAFGEAIVFPKRRESAPLEVIETSDRLKAAANEAAMPKPETTSGENGTGDHPSLEQEWADVLNVEVENKEPENSAPEAPRPPVYGEEPPRYETPRPPYGYPHSFRPYGQRQEAPQEPMPETYLVWSVILTILCCLIPGIIAIVYSSSVSSKYYAGDIEGARRASRNAQIWCIVSVIAGIFWATLYMPLAFLLS